MTRSSAVGAPDYSETLPCEPESARRARLLVHAAVSAWGIGDLADVGALIVSELVANTVHHTQCRLCRVVVGHPSAGLVRISVADKSRDVPVKERPGAHVEDGRGLVLIDALSWRWGYDLHRWGKIVWAELVAPC
ncbi:ATP-binding protein [Streptomyces sp. NPDC053474]|uniref:ATP-binding protein n=1 Tax=Streptomyces sp. NPDC053474 TaxID=3365704 RepID=UPI0037D7A434